MDNLNTSYSPSVLNHQRIPWITFIFLTSVFFMAQHDFFYTAKIAQNFASQEDEMITSVAQGDIQRRIAFLSLGFFGFFGLALRARNHLYINGLGLIILGSLVWTFSSLVWTVDTALTVRRLILYGLFWLGALAIAKRFSIRNIILWVFFSTILFVCIGLIAEIILGAFRPFTPGYRFAGTLHPNGQGINCALLFFASMALRKHARQGQLFFLVSMVIALFLLMLTKSRTSIAAAFLAPVVSRFFVSRWRGKFILVICFILPIVIFSLFGNILVPLFEQGIVLGRQDIAVDSLGTLTGRIPLCRNL